ncbi:MAG: ATP-binding protein, partial [Candidatus Thorarchaeota archaeon]
DQKSIPEKYFNNFSQFEEDLNSKIKKNGELSRNLRDLNSFFEKIQLNELKSEKKLKEKKVKDLKENLLELDNNIESLKDKAEKIKKEIPEEFQNTDLDSLNNQISSINHEITSRISSFKTEENNYLSSLNKFFKSLNLKIFDENKIEVIISNAFGEQNSTIEKIIKESLELITDFSEDNVIDSFSTSKTKFQNEIGGLEKVIKLNKEIIKEFKNKKKFLQIIEKTEKSNISYKEHYDNAFKERNTIEKAIEILKEGQIYITSKVLPKTMENLTKILPILTADRYKDAVITEDYQIKVFDSKLGDYVEKVLFSGGTNDQIALAIRLAFAMATMQEDEMNESFIFLDEPLGFFDDERKNSLIDFLTHGIISNKFAQRIVVSNFQNIKPHFDFVVELENGKIIEQYRTGTLDSKQFQQQYKPIDEKEILILKESNFFEDDGYCELILSLENHSSYFIKELFLQIPELNVNISPQVICNINPGENHEIELGFNKIILENNNIPIQAQIICQENKKLQKRNQNLIYSLNI